MVRTKQIKRVAQGEFEKNTMTDENGQTFVEMSPGNWIDEETYNKNKERGQKLKLFHDIAQMTIVQIKQRLQELGEEITGKNLRKKDYVEKLRSALSLSANI